MQRSLLEPNERWRTPLDQSTYPALSRSFSSLHAAERDHRIAFGRGGFCMDAGKVPQNGPVSIKLDFQDDGYSLSGQGIVRWLAHQDDQMGVELTYAAEESRGRLIELLKSAVSFIPRSTGRQAQALAS